MGKEELNWFLHFIIIILNTIILIIYFLTYSIYFYWCDFTLCHYLLHMYDVPFLFLHCCFHHPSFLLLYPLLSSSLFSSLLFSCPFSFLLTSLLSILFQVFTSQRATYMHLTSVCGDTWKDQQRVVSVI